MFNWMKALAAAALALLAAVPASAAWRVAESPNFIVYSQAGEAKVREQVALLEDYHDFLRLLTGVDDPPAPAKLRVYLMPGRSEMRLARDLPPNAAGFYTASPSGIAAFADDRGGGWGADEEDILFHEIAHHFMMQYRPMAYPAWFVEGFAEYVMTTRLKPREIEFGQPSKNRAYWLSSRRWLPLDRVLFQRASGTPEERSLFYAQSWLLAHYLMRDTERRGKLKAYMAAAATGTPPREAFAAQFGDLKAFTKGLETYAFKHLTYSRMTRPGAPERPDVRIATLPASADDLLPAEAALYVGQRGHFAQTVLAQVRKQAARYPGDAYAKRVLATAEVLHGDGARGEALLDELLTAAPGDSELLYLKGMRHLIAGRSDEATRNARFGQARTWFARAHKADDNHWRALARYAESLSTDSRFDSDNTMNVLLKAHALAPQVSDLRMNAAKLMLMRGRAAEAEALLLPIASHPHDDALASAAQALLAEARSKAAGGAGAGSPARE